MENILIKARLKLKQASEGGRDRPIFTNYRPNHVFEYRDGRLLRTHIGQIQFDDKDKIYPGEESIVSVLFILDGEIEKYLHVGRRWWIHEGGRVIGEAEILSLPKDYT